MGRRVIYPILVFCLSLSMAAFGLSVAKAQGAAPAAGMSVICSGDMVMTVFVDADGQPTTAPHLCPDCAMAAASGLVPAPAGVSAMERASEHHILPAITAPVTLRRARVPQARGPPPFV